MYCSECGKELQEGWVVCPFCQTPILSGREMSGTSDREIPEEERYEKYPSVSPLPPTAIRKYESFLKQKNVESERGSSAAQESGTAQESGMTQGSGTVHENETGPEAAEQPEASPEPEKVQRWRRRRNPPPRTEEKQQPYQGERNEKVIESKLYDHLVFPKRGRKVLMGIACGFVLLLIFRLLLAWVSEFGALVSNKGLVALFETVRAGFFYNILFAVFSTGIALAFGWVLAYVCVKKIPLLSQISSLHMAVVCRVPEALWLWFGVLVWDQMWAINQRSSLEYILVYGIMGSAYLAAAFYRCTEGQAEEEKKNLSPGNFLKRIWQRGVLVYAGMQEGKNQGVGREVRRLFRGITLVGLVWNGYYELGELTRFLFVGGQVQLLVFELLLYVAVDGILSFIWGRIVIKAAVADGEVNYGNS